MDFNQRDYFYQMQQLRQMPFSPIYPYPDLYMSEMETERDLQYLQQMYPTDAKRMQKKIQEELDKLEYEGSMMYDEYPDRVSLLLICDRIEDALAREDAENQAAQQNDTDGEAEMDAMNIRRPRQGERFRFDRGRRNLLEVLLYNEMHKRRCRRRQCRRFW